VFSGGFLPIDGLFRQFQQAASFTEKGMEEDWPAAFMITGPATKITNLGAVKIVLGLKDFIFYLAFTVLFAILGGFFVDYVLGV
jgi:uncharacterized membrane protein YraQ (UPF0718 family)